VLRAAESVLIAAESELIDKVCWEIAVLSDVETVPRDVETPVTSVETVLRAVEMPAVELLIPATSTSAVLKEEESVEVDVLT
jgi:hypothetical protein